MFRLEETQNQSHTRYIKGQLLDMSDPYAVVNRIEKIRKPVKTYSSSKINTPTRLKAKELLQKENTISRKSRLECLLCQQLQTKYGSKNPNSELNTIIKRTIHELLARYTNIESPELVRTIEDAVATRTQQYKEEVQQDRTRRLSRAQEQEKARGGSFSGNSRDSASTLPAIDIDPNQWSVLNMIQSVTLEEKARKEKELADLKKIKFRDELDQQLAAVEQKKAMAEEEKRRTREEFKRLNDSLEREKHVLETAKARKYEADRELITHQIEDSRRRREMEREHNIIQDQVDMRRAKARAKEEEDLKIAKRQREKAAQEQLRLENERHKALKAEQKRKEFEAEKRMEEEYRAKIEREEKARTEAFTKRMETMGRFEAKYATEGAGAKERENVRINEERLQREVQRKQQLEEANASKRDMERKERIRLASEENYRIMQEKEELRLSAKREGAALKLKYQAELDESSQTAAKEAARKRQKAMELKRGLDEQVSFKRQCESKEAMNGLDSRERELNKSLLKKMEQDPKYQHAIYERLHPTNKRETSFAFA